MSLLRRWRKTKIGAIIIGAIIAGDMFINGLMGGSFHETISERIARDRARGGVMGTIGCAVVDTILWPIDPNHCKRTLPAQVVVPEPVPLLEPAPVLMPAPALKPVPPVVPRRVTPPAPPARSTREGVEAGGSP